MNLITIVIKRQFTTVKQADNFQRRVNKWCGKHRIIGRRNGKGIIDTEFLIRKFCQ